MYCVLPVVQWIYLQTCALLGIFIYGYSHVPNHVHMVLVKTHCKKIIVLPTACSSQGTLSRFKKKHHEICDKAAFCWAWSIG